MIYLIDDSSKAIYNVEYLKYSPYKDILSVIENITQFKAIEDQLTEADCIFTHLSFDKSNLVCEKLKIIADDGDAIPIVIFSASDSGSPTYVSGSGIIDGIKKSVFYARLQDFLNEYIKTGNVNLEIIAYGNHYIKEEIKAYTIQIMNFLNSKGNSNLNELVFEIDKSGILEKIILASQPALGITYKYLTESLLNSTISIEDLKNNLRRIVLSFYQYGKNIYSWK